MDEHMDEQQTTDTGDDYSYDMAHDVPAAGRRPTTAAPRRPSRSAAPDTAPAESGDYSYDLAHEVPQPERRQP